MPGAGFPPRQPRLDGRESLAVEAEAIDHRLVPREAEKARTRIAGLRQRRHRADLGEAEAKRERRVDSLAMLVKTGGEPERIGKIKAERLDREAGIIGFGRGKRQMRQRLDREAVRGLWVELQQKRPCEGAETRD